MKLLILISALLVTVAGYSAELKGVKMDDSITVGKQKLLLNGLGLRVVNKFGINFNVYVGALYASKKSSKPEEIIKLKTPKRIVMHFILGTRVEKKKLVKGWKKVWPKVCEEDCKSDEIKKHKKAFYKLMDDMKKGQEIVLDFDEKGLTVTGTGRYKKSGRIESAIFARNILRAFISSKIPKNKLNTGLLGAKID